MTDAVVDEDAIAFRDVELILLHWALTRLLLTTGVLATAYRFGNRPAERLEKQDATRT